MWDLLGLTVQMGVGTYSAELWSPSLPQAETMRPLPWARRPLPQVRAHSQPAGARRSVRAQASARALGRACACSRAGGRGQAARNDFFWREAAFVHAHVRAMRSQLRAELPAPTHLLPGECLADFPASAPSLNESIVTVGGGSEMDTNGHTGD